MSKSRGNVVDPDEQVRLYGADTVRAYLMFGYQWADGGLWNTDNIQGVVRWLNRVWLLGTQKPKIANPAGEADARALARFMHQAIRRVTRDLEEFQFNTVVSTLMEFTNTLFKYRETALYGGPDWEQAMDTFLALAAPVVPHISEELWSRRKGKGAESIHRQTWPAFDPALAAEEEVTIVVQVNGKIRERLQVPVGVGEGEARRLALASEAVQKWLGGKEPRQVIYVPDRLINLVV
jgi:leucyl-tRNA synthetase